MKCKQLCPGFELSSSNPFPMSIDVTPCMLPILVMAKKKLNTFISKDNTFNDQQYFSIWFTYQLVNKTHTHTHSYKKYKSIFPLFSR